ncbi:SpoIIE family protein phosphatase [Telmatocola sphagniphila]|uniref:SpoIIE family protein phosphatase n=1 Tax=Telmatocola sphagniphila TaxID=1123043 RepID=A0A8E6B712_9BACT|nr:SpoIIE family protein phosphatase [Telmatocola sphagniphila]QVL33058.1 SpoIIE family protein phosphatase [Telmatocola sphagniphila]
MAYLILLKSPDGTNQGERVNLAQDLVVLGRSPEECDIVLPLNAVSRKHAQISYESGTHHIEDLNSRNKTFVNNKQIAGRTPLKDGDGVKICDFLYCYRDESKQVVKSNLLELPKDLRKFDESTDLNANEDFSSTTVEATLNRGLASNFLETQPSEKLRAILHISAALSKTLDIKLLLPQIADELFAIFRQADRCFIIQLDETNNQLIPVVMKTRRPMPGGDRFSRTIVRKCLESLQSYLSEDASSDANVGLAQSIAEFRIRSVMCVPLATQDGQPLGVIQLDSQDRTKKFNQEDLKLLVCVANQASVSLENARLHESLVKQQKLEEENKAATKVQRGFLPQKFPKLLGYTFYAHYLAARTVGGDYYDFIELNDGRVAVLLGDVSGKGVPAALLMARLSGEARVCILTQKTVGQAITKLNEQLMQANLEDRYVTLAAVVIDAEKNEITMVNAGHLSPWIYRHAEQKLEKCFDKDTGDFPIGWVPGFEYSEHKFVLGEGDSFIMFTDGIEDAQPANGVRFGTERVQSTIEQTTVTAGPLTAKDIGTLLIKAVQTHAAGHPQFDDIALVCFGRVDKDYVTTASSTKY